MAGKWHRLISMWQVMLWFSVSGSGWESVAAAAAVQTAVTVTG